MGPFGAPELIIVLLIIIVLFGVGRIGKIAGELGGGIRAFKQGLQDPDKPEEKAEKEKEKETPIDVRPSE